MKQMMSPTVIITTTDDTMNAARKVEESTVAVKIQ